MTKLKNTQFPVVSATVLALLCLGCLFADVLAPTDASYMDLTSCLLPPSAVHLFGTDTLGRDLFSCIWHGGRVSVLIGLLSTLVAAVIAIVYGTISGVATEWVGNLMVRFVEIVLSIPSLLLLIFLQAMFGEATVLSLSLLLGMTGWCGMAVIVRTEVRKLRESGYVIAAKCMGSSNVHLLVCHYIPNFFASIMFMLVMNVRTAIVAEATLSFMGLGLPLEIISWGSLLSLAEDAVMSGAWWVILIPGLFLIGFLFCLTNIGHWMQRQIRHRESML